MPEKQGAYNKTSPRNYYTIQNWMTQECGLRYPQRDIYAIMYGFTQDPNQWIEPTQSYIAEMVGISREAVNRNIKELEESGWLRKVTFIDAKRGSRSRYQTVTPEERFAAVENNQGGVTQDHRGCDPRSQGGVILDHRGCDPRSHQYLKDNKTNNKDNNTHTRGREASASKPVQKKEVAAKAARECVEDSDFEDFSNNFYKPVKPSIKAKARKEWDKLIADGYTPEQIDAKLEAYKAEKQREEVGVRFWVNLADFLATYVRYEPKTNTGFDVLKPSEGVKKADPKAVAALRSNLAGKYEWRESVPCGQCGAASYRDGDTSNYVCPNCGNAMYVKPRRTAGGE